jgi:hypothetical protein
MNRDFAEMLAELSATAADYMIVGAHALAAHGHPRATGDLGVWVRPSAENAPRVWAALRRFGAPLADLTVDELARPGIVFQMGVVPCRIDILTAISGVEFEDAWARRIEIVVDALKVPCIGRADLVANKLAAGRPKDLRDAELLTADDEG